MTATAYIVDLGSTAPELPLGEVLLRVYDDGHVDCDYRAEPLHVWTPVSIYGGSIRVEEQA